MQLDDDLLQAIHEGMFEQPLWTQFLNKAGVRMGALYCSLVFRPIDQEEIIELWAGPPTPPHLARLFDEKFARDPLPYRKMQEGRIYTLDELLDPINPVQRSYSDEFLAPLGIRNLWSVRIKEASGVDAWLNCAGGADLGLAAGALLNRLVPHMRIALRNFMALEREKFRASVTSDAFGRLNFGWLTLDAACRIIDMTPHVEQQLQRTTLLRRGRYDRLMSASPTVDRTLATLVKRYAQDDNLPPKAINLSRDPLMDMLVAPLRSPSVSANAKPVAIVYLSGDRRSQADRCEQLAELFGLLPSEARLAWAIASGLSIHEAAKELQLSIETARNYSKKIYAKTGSRGQVELVRTILTSVLAIA
ncbi:helix-turn-helix transcriptional regulator [Sphingobium yanoikuyae]|uniref:Chemotaxis protein CheY n=1 Tax=Sphingobium yanoikuyae TaxID=13690 RepID=A0A291MZX8_SPHYA|nr:chemotaxis protein CheY [Sphingobium yanoikuyae]ATI80649.1 chemotaxis protein CheY [Sphingobium yanoikuyae]